MHRSASGVRFYFDDQRWEWSEQVHRMHGYEPGTVTPTTELLLAHKHPNDRREVQKAIDDMLISRRPFSTRYRIVDTHGTVHQVVVVGDQLTDHHGAVIGTHGYYVDITPTSDRVREEMITARVAEITEHRGDRAGQRNADAGVRPGRGRRVRPVAVAIPVGQRLAATAGGDRHRTLPKRPRRRHHLPIGV